eukprot:COSAG01_NODE_3968_length_5483_cov_4.305906_3_plen_185_part_00
MLQRDFLEGERVQQHIAEVLAPVDNAEQVHEPPPPPLLLLLHWPGLAVAPALPPRIWLGCVCLRAGARPKTRISSVLSTSPPPPLPRPLIIVMTIARGVHGQDAHVAELNRIRASLKVFEQVGVGLRQPHLDRTRLCELADAELDPRYVQQRGALKLQVSSAAAAAAAAAAAGERGRQRVRVSA